MENYKVHYIYHSGFIFEEKDTVLVFDYFMEPKHKSTIEYLKNKNVIVFSSHSHNDHYNPEIFKWRHITSTIRFVLSSDIKLEAKKDDIYYLSKGQELYFEDIYIKAFGSTDLGVSFLVKINGINIFHGGDLNCWSWFDETTEENAIAEEAFKEEVKYIKTQCLNKIDIAFFPVDPRLKNKFSEGVLYFAKEIKPKIIIPMHFGNCYNSISKIKDSIEKLGVIFLNPEELI